MQGPIPLWVVRRIAVGLIGIAALVAVTLIEISASGLPWLLLIGLSVVAALFGPGEVLARTWRDWTGRADVDHRLDVEEAAKGAIIALSVLCPELSWPQIGITVFVVVRAYGHWFSGVQERIVRIRMESTPRPSTVIWTRKKGILGKCWREEFDVHLDHATFYQPYMNTTKEQWKALDPEITMGLSYRDFKDIRGYGLVLASPMKDHRGYRGCFVVQVPSELGPHLLTDDAKEVIHTFAATTCAVLK